MTNFPGPPTWASVSTYTQNQSEVYGSNGFYYVCTQSGISGTTQPTWASVFGTTVSDGTVTWITASRSRQPWQATHAYTAGLPISTTASVTTLGGTLTRVPQSQFIPIGAYVISGSLVPLSHLYGNVTTVDTSGSVIGTSSLGNVSSGGQSVIFNQYPYPYPDQIVTNPGASGSVVVQCTVTGVSGSGSQPTWPTASQLTKDASGNPEFNVVIDGTVTWQATGYTTATVPTWTANHTYPAPASVSAGGQWWYTTNGGTSGSSTPPWTYILDGSAQWAVVGVN